MSDVVTFPRVGIVVEVNGPRGSGKSYVASKIYKLLVKEGYKTIVLPGHTPLNDVNRAMAEYHVVIIDN